MRVRIISDGTSRGTKVVNLATGEQLEYVKDVQMHLSPSGVTADIQVMHVDTDVVVDAHITADYEFLARDILTAHRNGAASLPNCIAAGIAQAVNRDRALHARKPQDGAK